MSLNQEREKFSAEQPTIQGKHRLNPNRVVRSLQHCCVKLEKRLSRQLPTALASALRDELAATVQALEVYRAAYPAAESGTSKRIAVETDYGVSASGSTTGWDAVYGSVK